MRNILINAKCPSKTWNSCYWKKLQTAFPGTMKFLYGYNLMEKTSLFCQSSSSITKSKGYHDTLIKNACQGTNYFYIHREAKATLFEYCMVTNRLIILENSPCFLKHIMIPIKENLLTHLILKILRVFCDIYLVECNFFQSGLIFCTKL